MHHILNLANSRQIEVNDQVIDKSAVEAYTSGQCLAFAIELGKLLGSLHLTIVELADEQMRPRVVMAHAYATQGEFSYDISKEFRTDELTSKDVLNDLYECHPSDDTAEVYAFSMSPQEAYKKYWDMLPRQNWILARRFAKLRFEQLESDKNSQEK